MIKDIAWDETREATVVTLLDGFKHKYEDGDKVLFKEVKGMDLLDKEIKEGEVPASINTMEAATVKVINPTSFIIDHDARKLTAYQGNGIAKQIKVPKKLEFKTMEELDALDLKELSAFGMDPNLEISDFEKLQHKNISHYIYKAFLTIL